MAVRKKTVGILQFATAGDRMPGDPGFPGTYNFPVNYGIVEGSYRDLIQGSEAVRHRLENSAKDLESTNVCGIAGDCGLMALYQSSVADKVRVPVISSSLIMLPLVRRLIASDREIGVITGHSELLGQHHLEAAGVGYGDGIVIQGMEEEPHFREVVIDGHGTPHYDTMRQDVLNAVKKLLDRAPSTGAILLECSNLAVFSFDICSVYGIPVFDINSAVRMLHEAVEKENFK